jgi:hypothetical protein
MTAILQLSGAKGTCPTGENFLQPAAAKVGAPPRWNFGWSEKNTCPPGPCYPYRDGGRVQRDLPPSKAKPHGRRITPSDPDVLRGAERSRFMLASATLGSTSLNEWVPGSSPGAPTTQSTETRRGKTYLREGLFRPVFRDREGGSCVSAYRPRLLATFWGAGLRRQKSRSRRQPGPSDGTNG